MAEAVLPHKNAQAAGTPIHDLAVRRNHSVPGALGQQAIQPQGLILARYCEISRLANDMATPPKVTANPVQAACSAFCTAFGARSTTSR